MQLAKWPAFHSDYPTMQSQRAQFCKICGKSCSSSSNLRKHLKVHTGETECPVCHYVLSSVQSLNKHMKSLHGKP